MTTTAKVLDINGNEIEKLELKNSIFAQDISKNAIYLNVKRFLASLRRGTASAKTRAEVSYSTRKMWRQKGTGRARQGSRKAPQWKGGGVVFGPKSRSFSFDINKKVRRQGILSSLSLKANEENITVLRGLKIEEPKTKELASLLNRLNLKEKTLLVFSEENGEVFLSGLNIKNLGVLHYLDLNTYDIANYKNLLITEEALHNLEEVY